ncbi:MAG: hypothetical protein IKY38_01450, partial [Anaerotignum sp.]|nr:hypothetical protein [Anaerotignum sp.]
FFWYVLMGKTGNIRNWCFIKKDNKRKTSSEMMRSFFVGLCGTLSQTLQGESFPLTPICLRRKVLENLEISGFFVYNKVLVKNRLLSLYIEKRGI